MQRHELDRILTRMLEAHGSVSDLNFTVGRPPQVEKNGELMPVVTDPPILHLTPFQTEAIALSTATRLPRPVYLNASCGFFWISRQGSATPGV